MTWSQSGSRETNRYPGTEVDAERVPARSPGVAGACGRQSRLERSAAPERSAISSWGIASDCLPRRERAPKLYIAERGSRETFALAAPFEMVATSIVSHVEVAAALYDAILEDSSVKDAKFKLAWMRPHSGNYDVQEAYAWLAGVLAKAGDSKQPARRR